MGLIIPIQKQVKLLPLKQEKRNNGGKMARDKKNWIQKAIKKPGSLRKAAGVKKGQKISGKELTKLSKSKNPTTRKRANLAKTLKGFKK